MIDGFYGCTTYLASFYYVNQATQGAWLDRDALGECFSFVAITTCIID